jgi:hypothetical protein
VCQSVQESASSNDNGSRSDGAAIAQFYTGGSPSWTLGNEVDRSNFCLEDTKVRLLLENFAHFDAIHLLVALRSRRPNGGAAASIE